MEKPSEKIMELLGLDRRERIVECLESHIIPLLKAGFTFDAIAQDYGVKGDTLRGWFISYNFDLYDTTMKEAKRARKAKAAGLLDDITKINREKMREAVGCDDMKITDRCQIEKTFGDRHSVMDGDPTNRLEVGGPGLTIIIGEDKEDAAE